MLNKYVTYNLMALSLSQKKKKMSQLIDNILTKIAVNLHKYANVGRSSLFNGWRGGDIAARGLPTSITPRRGEKTARPNTLNPTWPARIRLNMMTIIL